MTVNQTLRLPADLAALLNQAAQETGESRHATILRILQEYIEADNFSPGVVLGYVQLRDGEVDPDTDCPECSQPFGNDGVYIGFTAGLTQPIPFGPVCHRCAHTD